MELVVFTGQVTIPATPVASTDAASKSYVDAHGGGTGPFLPLTAGPTKPLTGNLYINDSIPKLVFTDTDTSTIASISANSSNLTYTTAATTRDHIFKGGANSLMTIEGTGNVGIGTTSPSQLLHLKQGNDGHTQKIQFGLDSIDNHIGVIAYDTLQLSVDENNANGNSAMTFRLDGQEAMRVSAQRYVGIGTTSPSYRFTAYGF